MWSGKHISSDVRVPSLSEHLLPLGFETTYEVDEKAERCSREKRERGYRERERGQ